MVSTRRLFAKGILHGGDFNPEQWRHDPRILEEDVRLMQKCGCDTFSTGIFAWAALEPEEGRYDFEWLDGVLERLHAAGRRVILATPSGARPLWMAAKYPEVRRVERDGRRVPLGERHNHCWSSPVYREAVRRINTELAARYSQHPAVVLWHVSNEYNGACYCELCRARFNGWLERRYGTLERLNHAWWTAFWSHTFDAWEQIDPVLFALDGLAVDWRRFGAWQVADFCRWEATPLRAANPELPITTNLMGFYFGLDYHVLAETLDVVSDDFYPGYDTESPTLAADAAHNSLRFDLMRCLKGDPRPWFLMESCSDGRSLWSNVKVKPPGFHELEMFQSLAHGSNGTLYFQWRQGRGGVEKFHGAVVHHSHPEETRSFREVTALSQRYAKLAGITDTLPRGRVALLLDWESRWAYHAALGMPDHRHEGKLVEDAVAHYLPFWSRGIGVDVLASTMDFGGYALVIAPKLFLLKPGVAARLRDYVERGGTLVLTHLGGLVNESGLCFDDGSPGDGLEALAGVFVDETDRLNRETDSVGVRALAGNPGGLAGEWRTTRVYSLGVLRGATPLAAYTDTWAAGHPALTKQHTGAGTTYFFLADFDATGYDACYASIIRALGLTGACGGAERLPPGVTAQLRVGTESSYLFLLNFGLTAAEVPVAGEWRDAETGAGITSRATLAPLSARVLTGR